VTENECVGITGVSIAVVHRDDVVVGVVVVLSFRVLGSGSWVLVVRGRVLAVLGVLTKSTKALHGRVAVVGSCERCSSEAGNCKGLVHFEVSWLYCLTKSKNIKRRAIHSIHLFTSESLGNGSSCNNVRSSKSSMDMPCFESA